MIEAVIAAIVGAVVGAGWGALTASRESRKAAALQLMQRVEDRLSAARYHTISKSQAEALHYYRGDTPHLSPGAAAYLDYLSALEFTLYCVAHDLVAASDVDFWLRGILSPSAADRAFILALREASGDSASLEHLCKRVNVTGSLTSRGRTNV